MRPFDLAEFVDQVALLFSSERVTVLPAAGLSVSWGNLPAGKLADRLFAVLRRDIPKVQKDLVQDVIGMLKMESQKPKPPKYKRDTAKRPVTNRFGELNDFLAEELGKGTLLYGIWKLGVPELSVRWPWFTREEGRELYRAGVEVIGDPQLLMARFGREGIIDEIFTPNFDNLLDTACWAVGFEQEEDGNSARDSQYGSHFTIIADRDEYVRCSPRRGLLRLVKFHGCADKTHRDLAKCFAEESKRTGKKAWRKVDYPGNFIITYRELLNWRTDDWARDMLADRLRNHSVLFWGFSGVDPVLHATIRSISGEVHGYGKQQRFYAIDPYPDFYLKMLTQEPFRQSGQQVDGWPLLSPDGWITGQGVKADQEWVARLIYAETMKRLLESDLRRQAEISIPRWFPGKSVAEVRGEVQGLLAWFSALDPYDANPAAMDLLWHCLPGAVALSWAAQQKRQFLTGRRDILWRQFYVSLREHLEITLAMLWTYWKLSKVGDGRHIRFRRGGWVTVEVSAGQRKRSVSLLPAVLPGGVAHAAISPALRELILSQLPDLPGPKVVLGLTDGQPNARDEERYFAQASQPVTRVRNLADLDGLEAMLLREACLS